MTKIRIYLSTLLAILAFASFQVASAATTTSSLGNTASGLSDGDIPAGFLLGGIQSGQPAPFDQSYGADELGFIAPFDVSWEHNYAAIPFEIAGASLTIGIVDHDSAASGDQVSAFFVDGFDLTAQLNNLMNGSGGGDGMYNEYTLDLLGVGIPNFELADGSVLINLALGGPGLTTCTLDFICPGAPIVSETAFNGANLIYSTLTIEPVPIPAAAPLFASALVLMGLYRRRIQRKDV